MKTKYFDPKPLDKEIIKNLESRLKFDTDLIILEWTNAEKYPRQYHISGETHIISEYRFNGEGDDVYNRIYILDKDTNCWRDATKEDLLLAFDNLFQ